MNTPLEKALQAPQTPGLPLEKSPFDDVYILSFINKRQIQTKNFRASGDIQTIVQRAKAHCEQCGYRFLFVEPFLADFIKDELKHRASY